MSQGAEDQFGFPSGSPPLRTRFSDPLPAPPGWQRQELPLGERGTSHRKGANPGEPAESLESPFFFHRFIPFLPPTPHLCFVRLSRIRASRRGFRAVGRFPRDGQTDRLPVSGHAPPVRRAPHSALPGAPRSQAQDYTFFFFF